MTQTQFYTKTEADAAIAAAVSDLVAAAPGALNTLKELADAINDDASFAATVTTALAAKVASTEKAAANGVATLGSDGIVPITQLPQASPQSPQGQGTYLSSGGDVTYSGSGLTSRVSAGVAYFNFVRTPFSATNVTLGAAHATLNRFDAIVVDNTGTVSVVAGTAAATPTFPDLDPITQYALTYVRVDATVTTLSITTTDLYKENTEWTASVSGASVVANSTNNPFAGTKCIEFTTAAAGAYVRLTIPSGSLAIGAAKQLVLQIRSKAALANAKSILATWFNGSTKVGQSVSLAGYGFNSATTGSYQQIVIPIPAFLLAASDVATILELKVNGSGASWSGGYVDNVVVESASSIVITGTSVTDASVAAAIWAALVKPWVTLTDGATITWDVTTIAEAKAKVTLGGSRTLAITGATNGQRGVVRVTQDGTGSRGLTLPTGSIQVGGGGTTAGLSTAASAVDLLAWEYDGTNYIWTVGKAAA